MSNLVNNILLRHRNDEIKKLTHDFDDYMKRIDKSMYIGFVDDDDCTISMPVAELTADLFSECYRGKSLKRLHYTDVIKVSEYMTSCSVIVSLVYLNRLKEINPEFLINHSPEHIFFISILIANKFLYDSFNDTVDLVDSILSICDLSYDELIKLENEFLNEIEWKAFVSLPCFWKQLESFETLLALKQGLSREWFTYTELEKLLNRNDFRHLIRYIILVSVFLLTVYTVGIFAMVITFDQIAYKINTNQNIDQVTVNNSNALFFEHIQKYCNLSRLNTYKFFLSLENKLDFCQKNFPNFHHQLIKTYGYLL